MPAEKIHIPPHSIQAEQAVIGAALIDARSLTKIADRLSARDFYRADHRGIFAALEEMHAKAQTIDLLTVSDFLSARGTLEACGGLAYLGTLARDTPTAENVESYAAIVIERARLRHLQSLGADLERQAGTHGDSSAEELIGAHLERVLELQARARTGTGLVCTRELAGELLDDFDARCEGRRRGLPIGLSDFDELTGGLEAGDLVVIAGRPGMGKTALLVTIAASVAVDRAVAVFSAEMPALQLMRRAVALLGEIPQHDMRRPARLSDDDWKAIHGAAAELAGRHLWIDQTPLPRLAHIRSESLRLKATAGLGLILVDYVQLVHGAGANRYEQLRDVAYGLKAMAKDLAVPVIVLAQLNRGVEAREQKRPHVSDLRDSGAIEEAADVVGLLYSEGYYDPEFAMPYVLECRIDKHRNGERAECLWRFSGEFSRVAVLDAGARAQYLQQRAKRARSAVDDL